MRPRRSGNLRRINLMIGVILIIAGVAGGFLLTFWFLIVLLPITCVAASWMMTLAVPRHHNLHVIATLALTTLFLIWVWYFLQNGAEMRTWYGIFGMWALLLMQAAAYLSGGRQQTDSADV